MSTKAGLNNMEPTTTATTTKKGEEAEFEGN